MSNAVVPLNFLAGRESLGTHNEGWTFDQPSPDGAERVFRSRVEFSRAFASAPLVHVGLCGFDIGNKDAARLRTGIENVSATGFDLVVGTWLHTRLWSVEVSWLALGA